MYELLKLKLGKQNLCPFPHKHKDGKYRYEKQESCGITNDGKFNCFVCGKSFTDENWFTASYLNVSLNQAKKFNTMLKDTRMFLPQKSKWQNNISKLKEELKDTESPIYLYLKSLDLLEVVETARLGLYQNHITLPTFFKGQIVNICQFRPGEKPKYINSKTAISGMITTTKSFKKTAKKIMICAGEKDMLIATKNGFNAITIIGGEKTKPYYYKNIFKNKIVYIAYDNDQAGIDGALDLAKWLYRLTRKIKILNVGYTYTDDDEDLTVALKEEKEDIADFFIKYKKTDLDLQNIIDNCQWYQPPALEHKSVFELINDTRRILKTLEEKVKEENKQHARKKEEK